MKSNLLTNTLLATVLVTMMSGQFPAVRHAAVEPATAASVATNIPGKPDDPMIAISGYISIPAAAFHPRSSGATYENTGQALWSNSMTGTNRYVAEVNLPQGATIDALECFMADQMVSSEGSCELDVLFMSDGTYHPMGTVNTSGFLGYYFDYSTSTISYASVDNYQNAYFLNLYLPGNGGTDVIYFFVARIHYYFNAVYLPSVSK